MSALIAIVAGPYNGAYNSNPMGETEDGFDLIQTFSKEDVTGDLYGDSVFDSVYRGGNCFMQATGLSYTAAASVRNPYGATFGAMGLVGRMDVGSEIAKSMTLTAVAGTTAAQTPATLTSLHAIVDKDINQAIKYASRARKVPMVFRLFPYKQSEVVLWFTMT